MSIYADEEFKTIYNTVDEKLYKKGYYISNMVYDPDYYEIYDGNAKVVMCDLTLAQLEQLAEIIENRRY